MNPTDIAVPASALVTVGVYIATIRALRRDVNGIGRKLGKLNALLLRWADTPEKCKQLADYLDGR